MPRLRHKHWIDIQLLPPFEFVAAPGDLARNQHSSISYLAGR